MDNNSNFYRLSRKTTINSLKCNGTSEMQSACAIYRLVL